MADHSQKEQMKQMGEKCGVSPADSEKLFGQGLTTETVQKAEMHGINLLAILQMFNTYGPVAVAILNDLLARLKQVTPMQGQQK